MNKINAALKLLLFYAFIVFIFSYSGCKNKTQNNFILITLDTQRADFINAYNPGSAQTPNLDSLAINGTLYENCFSLIPTTLPSHASIFFSRPPHDLKVYNNGQVIQKSNHKISIAKIFKKHQYTTAAFVSLGVLKSRFGLNDSFDLYNDDFSLQKYYITAEEINHKLLPWLEQNKNNNFFLWVHYSDPHAPYFPPNNEKTLKVSLNNKPISEFILQKTKDIIDLKLKKRNNRLLFEITNKLVDDPTSIHAHFDKFNTEELEKRYNIKIQFAAGWREQKSESNFACKKTAVIKIFNPDQPKRIKFPFRGKIMIPFKYKRDYYRAEVEYMDKQLGSFLTKLKDLNLYKKTNILVVGDHGEGLGEYEKYPGAPHFGHIHFLYTVYMKVPFIIYRPDADSKAIRISDPVSLLDIAPTILGIMKFNKPLIYQGRNLIKRKSEKNNKIFMEAYRPLADKNKFGIYFYPWHLIFTPEEQNYELFNLINDPSEHNNIINISPSPPVLSILKQEINTFSRKALSEKQALKIDITNEEMLRALGYIK